MIKVDLLRVILLGLISLFVPASLWAQAQYAGGSGTAQDPYQISTAAHFANITNNPTAYFRLIDDITITAFPGIEFSGELNGATADELDRHVITLDVTIENQDYAAMFRKLTGGAVIENLRLTGHFSGDNIITSAVIAVDMDGGSVVRNILSNVEMVIAGDACCSDDQDLQVGHGGLIAKITNGTLSRSANWGRTEAWADVGGLVGINQGQITESFNAGFVVGNFQNGSGGLVGNNQGIIENSYSAGGVEGDFSCGGLAGGHSGGGLVIEINNVYSSTVVDCDSNNNLTDFVGGLIGQRSTINSVPYPVNNSFWDTEISGKATSNGGVGKTTEEMTTVTTFTNAGWDFTATGPWTMQNLNQQTDAIYPSLKNVPSDVCAAGDFSETGFQPCAPCIGETNRGERLGATSCSIRGSGTSQDPYQIATPEDFANIAQAPSQHFRLVNDITITTFPAIEFSGVLNGATADELDRHVITLDVTVENEEYVGIFRKLSGTAVVENLRLAGRLTGTFLPSRQGQFGGIIAAEMDNDSTIRQVVNNADVIMTNAANGDDFGALVGRITSGTLEKSANWGRIEAVSGVGGLVAKNGNGGTVRESFNAGPIVSSGGNGVGGLVASNSGTISNSYSTGVVAALGADPANCGGLVGVYSSGGPSPLILNAFASGAIDCLGDRNMGGLIGQRTDSALTVTASIWDTEATGRTNGAGRVGGVGLGATTEQMTSEATFTSAGWDFSPTGPWTMQNLNQHTDAIYPSLKNVPSDVCKAGEFSQTGFEPCRKCIGETNRGERLGATSCSTGLIFIDRFQNNTASQ